MHYFPTHNRDFVENLIPQKKPFVLVDALLEYTDSTLKSAFTIPTNHIFVTDGVLEASGVLEHQAQSVALHTGFQFFLKKEEAPVGYIGAIKSFSVNELPKIGDTLESEISIISEFMGVTLVKITTKINQKMIAASEMKTVLKP